MTYSLWSIPILFVLVSGCAAPAMAPFPVEPELPVVGHWGLLGALPGSQKVEMTTAGDHIFMTLSTKTPNQKNIYGWDVAANKLTQVRSFDGYLIAVVGSGDDLYVFIREGPDRYSLVPHIYRYHVPSATWNENRILSEDNGFFGQVHNSARGVSHAGKIYIAGGCCSVASLWEYDTSSFELHHRGRIDETDDGHRYDIPLVWSTRHQRLIVGPGRYSGDGDNRDTWQSYAPGGVLEPYTMTAKGRTSPVLADESGLWTIYNRQVSRLEPGTPAWHETGLPTLHQEFGVGLNGQLYFAAYPNIFGGELWRWTPPKDIPWE